MQEEVGGVAPVGLFSARFRSLNCPMIMDRSDSNDPVRRGSLDSQTLNGAVFREVAMRQIYLTITVSSLTLLIGVYVLGVVLL